MSEKKTDQGKVPLGDEDDDFRVIFIAGNESFSQGPINYRKACKAAIDASSTM